MSLLGVDLGTTGCKAGVFTIDGRCLALAYREYHILHAEPGWAELDSHDVWEKTREVISEAARQTAGDPISALAVSSFAEAVVPVTKDGKLLDVSILSMDDRGKEHSDRLLGDFGPEKFYRINGNIIGPNFTLPKLLWLREHRPDVYRQADYFLLWSDLIAFLLGGEPAANNSLANRTLLFDIEKNDWSDELLAWGELPRAKLGRIVPGGEMIGTVSPKMSLELGLPAGVKIIAGGHDQCCNALGCGAVSAGKAVYGLGSFDCITPLFQKPQDTSPLLRAALNIEHHLVPGLFVSFLFNQAGFLVKWFRDTFAREFKASAGSDVYSELLDEMPAAPTRLLALPHFLPPVFPRHISDSSGMLLGLKTETKRGEILKSLIESSALYFVESVQALKNIGLELSSFIAAGGAAKSDAGLQIRADIFGLPITRPKITEGGLLGAAMLAGAGSRVFATAAQAAELLVKIDSVFEPDAQRHGLYMEKQRLFQNLYPALKDILARL